MYWSGFPDGRIAIDDQVAEGATVVTRWTSRATHTGEFMQIAPTGKQVAVGGIHITRVADGKVVENWVQFDQLGMLQQLGGRSGTEDGRRAVAANQSIHRRLHAGL